MVAKLYSVIVVRYCLFLQGTLKPSKHLYSGVVHVYGTYCNTQLSTLLSCAYQYPYQNYYYYYYNYYCDIKCVCKSSFVKC